MVRRVATKPRKLPRQRRSKATFDALLTAAAHILVRDGYEKAGVNVIAKRAGCSIGSLYQYFPSKEALVAAVMRRHTKRMIDVFFDSREGLAALTVEDAARNLVVRTFDAMAVDPRLQKVIVEQVPRRGLLVLTRKFEAEATAVLRGYFETHRDELELRDPDLAATIVVQAVGAVVIAAVVDDPRLLARARITDELTELVGGYLRNGYRGKDFTAPGHPVG